MLLELALVELLHGRAHALYLPPSPEVSRVLDAGKLKIRMTAVGVGLDGELAFGRSRGSGYIMG
jgi:hypothetical protein